MSLCINPNCPKPQNPNNILFCETCSSGLLLQNRYRVIRKLGYGGFGVTFEINEVRTNQPEKRSNSWLATIREQRIQIKRILADSPSLKSYLEEAFLLSYQDGINLAVKETNLPYETFPENCNYAITQILETEFLPES
jgi:hypothetical protein